MISMGFIFYIFTTSCTFFLLTNEFYLGFDVFSICFGRHIKHPPNSPRILITLSLFAPSFRLPPSYVYGAPPYLNTGAATAGLVPVPGTQLSHAAAIAAATSQFYEYQNAVVAAASAPYPSQYSAGFDQYAALAGNY